MYLYGWSPRYWVQLNNARDEWLNEPAREQMHIHMKKQRVVGKKISRILHMMSERNERERARREQESQREYTLMQIGNVSKFIFIKPSHEY